MDRRQKRSHDSIVTAFSQLLAQKSFNKITVQDIIDAANVGRTTFYAHFETKDDLLRELCQEIFDHVISSSLSEEIPNDHFPLEIVSHILFHLADNQKNIIGLLSGESSELFLGYFKEYLNQLVSSWIPKGKCLQPANVPQDFVINHISGSFVNMVRWWVKGGLKQTPDELASYFYAVVSPLLTADV